MIWLIISSFISGILTSIVSTAFSIVFFIIWSPTNSEVQYAYLIGLMIGEGIRNVVLHDTCDIIKKLREIEKKLRELEKIILKLEKYIQERENE